jgi:hypothetical protein
VSLRLLGERSHNTTTALAIELLLTIGVIERTISGQTIVKVAVFPRHGNRKLLNEVWIEVMEQNVTGMFDGRKHVADLE